MNIGEVWQSTYRMPARTTLGNSYQYLHRPSKSSGTHASRRDRAAMLAGTFVRVFVYTARKALYDTTLARG
jgi:hypothetical protein